MTIRIFRKVSALAFMVFALTSCGVNNIPSLDEQVKAAWAQVENQYQRRADLVPNLVATVKGYAAHETETFQAVTNARAQVGSINITAEMLGDAQAMQRFEAAQAQLTSALSRLLAVSENYPDLKANQNFLALQSQLEGTENRISVARRDYIAAVRDYNTEIRTFPGRIWHSLLYSDMEIRETFEATGENLESPPQVDF